jgi:hypothetical protein
MNKIIFTLFFLIISCTGIDKKSSLTDKLINTEERNLSSTSLENLDHIYGFRGLKLNSSIEEFDYSDWNIKVLTPDSSYLLLSKSGISLQFGELNLICSTNLTFSNKKLALIDINWSTLGEYINSDILNNLTSVFGKFSQFKESNNEYKYEVKDLYDLSKRKKYDKVVKIPASSYYQDYEWLSKLVTLSYKITKHVALYKTNAFGTEKSEEEKKEYKISISSNNCKSILEELEKNYKNAKTQEFKQKQMLKEKEEIKKNIHNF